MSTRLRQSALSDFHKFSSAALAAQDPYRRLGNRKMLSQKLKHAAVGFALTSRGMDKSHVLSVRNLL